MWNFISKSISFLVKCGISLIILLLTLFVFYPIISNQISSMGIPHVYSYLTTAFIPLISIPTMFVPVGWKRWYSSGILGYGFCIFLLMIKYF